MANDPGILSSGQTLGIHGSIPAEEQRNQPSQGFENIKTSGNARLHMGNAYTKNVYSPAALFNSVQMTAPDDPVHSEFANACAEGQRQARLNHLIRRGANIDHRDYMQGTPLHHAAFAGHVDTVHYLLDAGADIDAAGDWLGTPLGLASAKGHIALVELFLAHRANPNRYSKYVGTAAHMACAAGRLDILLLLTRNGAMLNVQIAGCTRTYKSFTQPRHKYLSSSRAYNLIPNTRLDILLGSRGALAVLFGRVDIVDWLLGQPHGLQLHDTANFTVFDPLPSGVLKTQWQCESVSLVILAVFRLQIDMLRWLLARGGNAKFVDSLQRSAILWIGKAIGEAFYDADTSIAHSVCLSMLLQHGAHIEDRDRRGWTALIFAAVSSKFSAARILLDQGASTDAGDNLGRTPLMFAVCAELDKHMRTRFVRLLCERGADVGLKDAFGRTALDRAETTVNCGEVKTVLLRYSSQ